MNLCFRAGCFLLVLTVVGLAVPAWAQGTAQAPSLTSPLNPAGGQQQWSGFYELGFNQNINNSAEGINLTTAGVRWSYLWGEYLGGLLKGHPAIALEFLPVMAFLETGETTWAIGANLLYEHHFAVKGRVLPVWKIGAGLLYADKPIPDGETQHNFSVLTSLGVDVLVTHTTAIFAGYRFHHVSNANTGTINPGINVHAMVFGVSFYR